MLTISTLRDSIACLYTYWSTGVECPIYSSRVAYLPPPPMSTPQMKSCK